MIKRFLYSLVFIVTATVAQSQQSHIDSLVRLADSNDSDTIKLVVFRTVSRIYAELDPDSAYHYAEKSLKLAREMNFRLDEGSALREMAYALLNRAHYPRSLQTTLASVAILENPDSERKVLIGKFPGDDDLIYRTGTAHEQRLSELAFTHQIWGVLYANTNNYEKALMQHRVAGQLAQESGNLPLQSIVNMTMARNYLELKKTDSALIVLKRAYDLVMQSGYKRYFGSVLLNMGRVYAVLGKQDLAIDYYRRSLVASAETYYFRGVVACNLLLAAHYRKLQKMDSAYYHINEALSTARNMDAPDLLLRSYTSLSDYYQSVGNNDSTVKYQALIIKINDSLFSTRQAQQFQNIDFDEQQRLQQIEAAKDAERVKFRMYALITGLAIFLFIAIMLYRNSLQRKKANELLSKQKKELETTLSTLKTTQNQLLQSEKMASLGEMTAGIAHEIQNPLNFVNNFSEVNGELINELKAEIQAGNKEEAISIANDIKENEEKINHHGKRADAIVKSMLQHSRSSSGKKELTDINILADEYVRLAYHGLRAKDKSFNAKFETDFDNSIGQIQVIPQEIGRVLLNLINNAFYAVSEKEKQLNGSYEPTVWIRTKKEEDKVEITVKDNGNGIPHKLLDKIFQPFFTTKPPGHGTGLGLSLSYDIVTKAHGGDFNVETREGEGTEFIIHLPAN
ncbi:MAG TPA: ATP-binding protein [Chitinophagaceae bacterium]|nr:ATP-binding protein [Chitinophagaceae bacterium]